MKKLILLFCLATLQVSFGQMNTQTNLTNKDLTKKEISLQNVLDNTVDKKKIFGTSFALKQGDFKWAGASGNLKKKSELFYRKHNKALYNGHSFTTQIRISIKSR